MARSRKDEIDRIKEVRDRYMKKHTLTKTAYAKKLGLDLKAYNQVERRGANATYLVRLYEAFGVSSDYILHGIKSPF